MAREDKFDNVPDEGPRIVVIGETGSGKSSLLNKLSGVRYSQIEIDGEVKCVPSSDTPELFPTGTGASSVTQSTRIEHVKFFLDSSIKLSLIDTPGKNDRSGEASHFHNMDVQLKLRKLRFVHMFLVCVSASTSGRLTNSTADFLRGVADMFKDTCKHEGTGPRQSFWDHVVLAYTYCDETDKGWKQGLKTKIKEMRDYLADNLNARRTDGKQLPVLTLSSLQKTMDAAPNSGSQEDQFQKLVQIANNNFKCGRQLQTTEMLQFSSAMTLLKAKAQQQLEEKEKELKQKADLMEQIQRQIHQKDDELKKLKAEAQQQLKAKEKENQSLRKQILRKIQQKDDELKQKDAVIKDKEKIIQQLEQGNIFTKLGKTVGGYISLIAGLIAILLMKKITS